MPYDLKNKLVVGVASSAVFDLAESDAVFKQQGEEEYRKFQQDNINKPLEPGMAYPFIRRLLSINSLQPDDPMVEVILLSRNDPDTGIRVMKTIEHYKLGITRAIFMQGKSPCPYIPALNISLFLSANEEDVREAIQQGYPAGRVLNAHFDDDEHDDTLRIAFDFDGVLANDESESVMQSSGLNAFHEYEVKNVAHPHHPGPLKDFIVKISAIQSKEEAYKKQDPSYKNKIRVSIVTARNALLTNVLYSHLKAGALWQMRHFFLVGLRKRRCLR